MNQFYLKKLVLDILFMSQIEIWHVMAGLGAVLIFVCGFISHCVKPCWCMCCCRECVRKKTDNCCNRGNNCCNRGKTDSDSDEFNL